MTETNQVLEVEKEKGSVTWEEIERAESYMVSCMFVEATSLASSIIKKLCHSCVESNDELNDMLEAAGMVVVQSLKEGGRTLEILKELKLLFGSVTSTPAQVFVTGVCLQMSEDRSLDVQQYLEEYLCKWTYKDGYYVSVEANVYNIEESDNKIALGVDQYLEVVELYVITFLAVSRRDIDLAISWVEKAALPEEKRQELLRRLHSMSALAATSSLQPAHSSLQKGEYGVKPTSTEEQKTYTKFLKDLESEHLTDKQASTKETILKLSRQRAPFSWFPNITLRFGNNKVILSNAKILLGCFFLLMCYFMQRKRASIKRVLKKQAVWIKKGVVDLWQLAFSYQVNPLAAVQPLSAATPGSR